MRPTLYHIIRPGLAALASLGIFSFPSCGPSTPENSASSPSPLPQGDSTATAASQGSAPTQGTGANTTAEIPPSSPRWTQQSAQAALRRANPEYKGEAQIIIEAGRIVGLAAANTAIADLSPLVGEPVRQLELTATAVRDLSPLQGMPLAALFIEQTLVEDLSPIRGAPLETFAASECPKLVQIDALEGAPLAEIRLTHTRVADLSPLKGAPLQAAWFSFSPVIDISPLKGAPLVTLTLHRTQVADLAPLAGSQLQRLHIAETPVTDLSPLAGLPLTRLVFTPFLVERGIDAVRQNPDLREIGTRFNDQSDKDLMPPAQFWPQWDAFQQERARQLLSPNPPPAPTQPKP